MAEQLVNRSVDDVCAEICSRLDGGSYIVNPSRSFLQAMIDWSVEHPDRVSPMRLLGDSTTLKGALSAFPVATRAAELVEANLLELRTHPAVPKSSLAVDGTRAVVLVDAGECVGALSTSDRSFVGELTETCADAFAAADGYRLHTPAISRIEATLSDRLGEDRWEDFAAIVEGRTAEEPIDEVNVSLLVAARHGDLLYDISKWGEDIGLASKATFSRKKSELEAVGLIRTESEPIDVGRPRLRLYLGDPALEELSTTALIEEADRRLS